MGIIILGAFVAGARDLSFDVHAYTVVFISNICTAIYLASIARIGNRFSNSSHVSIMVLLGILFNLFNSMSPQIFR